MNKKEILIIALILVILMGSAFAIRAQTWNLPAMDMQAQSQIENSIKNSIAQEIRSENPNISDRDLQRATDRRYAEFYRENKEQIDAQIAQLSSQYKEHFRNDSGETYLIGIDPYHYWRYKQNYLEQGFYADSINERGNFVDELQLAPFGNERGTRQVMHPVISAWTYNLFSWTGVTPYWIFFMMPALVGMLTVIPAFFIGRKIGGNVAGTVAGVVMATAQSFVGRSVGGFSSTDSYNLLFPLLMFWFLVEAFDAKDLKGRVIFGSLSGLAVGIFSTIWGPWSFFFLLLLVTLAGYIGFLILRHYIQHRKVKDWTEIKEKGVIAGTIFVSSGIFVSWFGQSITRFFMAPINALGYTSLQDSIDAGLGLWPNVLTTVAELARPSVDQILGNMGGRVLFFVALLGLFLVTLPSEKWKKRHYAVFGGGILGGLLIIGGLPQALAIDSAYTLTGLVILTSLAHFILLLYEKDVKIDIPLAIFVNTWFIAAIFSSTQGVRFLLLLVPPFAIAVASTFGRMHRIIEKFLQKKKKWNVNWSYLPIAIIFLLLFSAPIAAGWDAGKFRTPLMNDAWYDSLTWIRDNTDEDAIITSWWDYGHWFKAVGERRVTFDGASQNTPMAHWVGLALKTSDEDEAIGILRMLDCSGRVGFETYEEKIAVSTNREFLTAIQDFKDLLLLDRAQALEFYRNQMSEADAQEMIELTHCDPPQGLFITSEDMIGKSSVWGHFGGWDFNRAYIINDVRRMPMANAIPQVQEVLGVQRDEARTLYMQATSLRAQRDVNNWISEYPSYVVNSPVNCENRGNETFCPLNINIGQQQGMIIRIAGFSYANGQGNLELEAVNMETGFAQQRFQEAPALFYKDGVRVSEGAGLELGIDMRGNQIIVSSPHLTNSIFSRLFYWDGQGTTRFEKIYQTTQNPTNTNVKVWDVQW